MKKIKKYDYLGLTFILMTIIIGVIYHLQGVSPLGNKSLLTIDFFHQYGPMLGELYDRIVGGKSFIYSFNMGMGLPFFRNYFNYLSSPLNIIMLLFSRAKLLTSYSIIIGLKSILASLTMSLYLNKKFKKNYLYIALSCLYGVCAYFRAYYWNIMWLDGLVMLPLITFGIERLIDEKKPTLYIVSLAIMLYANYFIGYMLCLYSALYFLTYFIIKADKKKIKENIHTILTFTISSLLVGGICAFFLIPMFDALKGISATGDLFPTSQYYSFTWVELLYNHLSGVVPTVLKSDTVNAPNVSVGMIAVLLLPAFIFNSKINAKTKICYMALLGILLLSFLLAPLDFIWHAFHVPNDLPYRYSFIYSFILIVIAGYSLDNIKGIDKITASIIFVITLLVMSYTRKLDYTNISDEMLRMNYIVVSILYVSFMLSHFKKLKYPLIILVILTCSVEATLSVSKVWSIDHNENGFYNDDEIIKEIMNDLEKSDKGFFRIEKDQTLTYNDPSWYNYHGITTFSSMEYQSLAEMMHTMGLPSNEINSFIYKYNTPIFNMLFNLKYIIGVSPLNNYSIVDNYRKYNLQKSNYEPSLMYVTKDDIEDNSPLSYYPFELQPELIQTITGIEDVLKPVELISQDGIYRDANKIVVKYTFKNEGNDFYLYINHSDVDYFVIENTLYYLNENYDYGTNLIEENINSYIDYHEHFIVSDVSDRDEITLYVAYNYYDGDVYDLYTLNEKNWEKAYEYLDKNRVNITSFKESEIIATATAKKDTSVYTSIPYDKGWKVYVDDKEVNTFKISNALLGYKLPEGSHNIKLTYRIPYFEYASKLSLVSLIIMIKFITLKKEK